MSDNFACGLSRIHGLVVSLMIITFIISQSQVFMTVLICQAELCFCSFLESKTVIADPLTYRLSYRGNGAKVCIS